MGSENDISGALDEIPVINIINIEVKDMSTASESGHAFIIDTGSRKIHLNTKNRFTLERWVEAIEFSMHTAKEKQNSITGAIKNISQIVNLAEMNEDILKD